MNGFNHKLYTMLAIVLFILKSPILWFQDNVHDNPTYPNLTNLLFWWLIATVVSVLFVWYFLKCLFWILNPILL